MAAKPFYSLDEVCARLGKSPDDIKAMVREGMLREFRDAGKVFFKAEDVERLSAPAAPTADEIMLEPVSEPSASGSGGLPGIGEESSEGTSIIGLETGPDEKRKEGSGAPAAKPVGIFAEDEVELDADPMAKTQITTGPLDDQVSLESGGSGSGLLDLAREADDTALGADLLDEIYPGEEAGAPREEAPAAAAPPPPKRVERPREPALAPVAVVTPTPVAAPADQLASTLEEAAPFEEYAPAVGGQVDSTEGVFSGLLVSAVILMGLAIAVVGGAVQGFVPDYGKYLGDGSVFSYFVGGSLLLSAILLFVGWFVGKSLAPKR